MIRKRPPRSVPADYEVGYGKPPVETRFPPGQSGNPKGRPKARKSPGRMLEQLLATPIKVTENGRTRRISVLEAILRGVTSDALRRDPKAIQLLFALRDRYREDTEQGLGSVALDPDDQAILDSYFAQHQLRNREAEPLDGHRPAAGADGRQEGRDADEEDPR